ncbi:MAG: formylglycine-generating enzyme family protein [Sediminibacterium sp.]|nr:formylglycine-generating enzyme family protein [Sediminibacterium sp.]
MKKKSLFNWSFLTIFLNSYFLISCTIQGTITPPPIIDTAAFLQNPFFTENKMILITKANFTMGCNFYNISYCESDEFPTFNVQLSNYAISSIEVTQGLWNLVMGNNPSYFNGIKQTDSFGRNLFRPVENVSWDSAQIFISKLNQITKRNFRLPSEAEWEYAARGYDNNTYIFPGNNMLDTVAWFETNSDGQTHPVKQKLANSFGLYDMAGNVSEWCADYYGTYSALSKINPNGPAIGMYRVIRGGSFNYSSTYCRLSFRDNGSQEKNYIDNGFRLAETIQTP